MILRHLTNACRKQEGFTVIVETLIVTISVGLGANL